MTKIKKDNVYDEVLMLGKDVQYIRERHDDLKSQVARNHIEILDEVRGLRKVISGNGLEGGIIGEVKSLEKGQKLLWKIYAMLTLIITFVTILANLWR